MSRRDKDEEKREFHIERMRKAPPRRTRSTQGKKVDPKKAEKKILAPSKSSQQKPADAFIEKRESMKHEAHTLVSRLNDLPTRVNQVDHSIREVSTRISAIRAGGYYLPKQLEDHSNTLSERWTRANPELTNYSTEQQTRLLEKQSFLESVIQGSSSLADLLNHENSLTELSRDLTYVENSVNNSLHDYQSQYAEIDKEIRRAEYTAGNLSNTSIQWKSGEYPVYAAMITDMSNDKQGVLVFSSHRVLFEEEREEVIKKTLFFATEKRVVREVLLDQPIGSIDTIEKGRVGFFKGAGLFIKFKPQVGLDELKIDTRGDDDENIIHFHRLITSGQLEEKTEKEAETELPVPTRCENCSAPITEEVLMGQTSVKCKYCGSIISLRRR